MSLPFYREFGWNPVVISVEQGFVEAPLDPLLLETIPGDVPVHRVPAMDQRLTRRVGLGNLGLRALPHVIKKGGQLLADQEIDLVYFSTTMFAVMAAGRIWRRRFAVPYLLDFQDPWLSEYYENRPDLPRPRKYWFSHSLDRLLEPWTMRRAAGITTVSPDYTITLRRRYPWLSERQFLTLPFGASKADQDIATELPATNTFFEPGKGQINGVYVGRGGRDMHTALTILFRSFCIGLRDAPEVFSNVKLHFIGTDYAPADSASKSVLPVAERYGLQSYVLESPLRVPYFEALRLLNDADFLIVPGSDDPQYTASKIYPYILARKPMLAVFHRNSTVVSVLRKTKAGEVIPFDTQGEEGATVSEATCVWKHMLERLPFSPETDWTAFEPFTAREMTRTLCGFFDRIVDTDASSPE